MDGDLAYWLAGIHALLGDRAQALTWLRRAVEVGNHNYPWFRRDRNFERLRNDPEYLGIMNEIKSHWEEYQQAYSRG